MSKTAAASYGDKLILAGDPDAPLFRQAVEEINQMSEPELGALERFAQSVMAAREANRRGRWKMFTPSPRPSSPASTAIDDDNLGSAQRMRPKEARVSPMLAIQWDTSRAYCRVGIGRSRPRRPSKRNSPGFLLAAAIIIFDRLSRMDPLMTLSSSSGASRPRVPVSFGDGICVPKIWICSGK
jgi:hypothetical protein